MPYPTCVLWTPFLSPALTQQLSSFIAEAFSELWHFLRSNDLHELQFEDCPANGLPLGLIQSGFSYFQTVHDVELLRLLQQVYRLQQRELMLGFALDRETELTSSNSVLRSTIPVVSAIAHPSVVTTRSGRQLGLSTVE